MHYDLIIKGGTLVTPEKSILGDAAIKDGKIAAVGELGKTDTADEVYDAAGKFVMPGLIDAHVHFRDPGYTEKEDFESGSIAAAFGGITTAADMPNVMPVTSTAERFYEKVKTAGEKSCIDFALFALLTDDNLHEMEELKKAGALGFKIFLGTSTGDLAAPVPGILYEQMLKSAALGMRCGFHAETSSLNSHFTEIYRKRTDAPLGILLADARPVISEVSAVKTALCYAKHTGAKIHLHHITSAEGVKLAQEVKKEGTALSAETCPHYLFLSAEETAHKVYPPIRGESQRRALWEAVQNGTIDMIASDHAPHTAAEKALPVWEAPAGLCGAETIVPLMLNAVNQKKITINKIVSLMSEEPAKIWGIYPQKGSLSPGADADFTVVDMRIKKKITADGLHSKSKTSPYDGMEIQGAPAAVIVRGRFVMRDGVFTGERGYGRLISPAP